MTFKKNFLNFLFYPQAILSAIFFFVFSVISYGIIENGVQNSMKSQLNSSVEIFAGSIRENVVTGGESEVFRKCNSFAQNSNLRELVVKSFDGRKICDIGSGESSPAFFVSKQVFYDEDRKELAATVSMAFVDEISGALLTKSLLILFFALVALIAVYILVGKYFMKTNISSVIKLADYLKEADLSSLKNISDKLPKNSVEELRLLYKGVEDQARKVEMYQEELVEATKWKAATEFASFVAHDIKSPMSNIEMIADDEANDPVVRKMLRNSVERVYEMIDEVISVGKSKHFGKSENLQVVSVKNLVEDYLTITRYAVESSSDIKIKFIADKSEHFDVLVSPARFRRAIANILKNSIEALGNRVGKIDISLSDGPKQVTLAIKDNGVGVSADRLPLLGSKGATFEKEGGTGYGLFQVKEMVEEYGGSLVIDSELGKGMTVKVILPKYDSEIGIESLNVKKDQRIVIVDDEEHIFKSWQKKFAKAGLKNKLTYFKTSNEFGKWVEDQSSEDLQKVVGLFDNDLKERGSGLELLANSSLGHKILVTGDDKSARVVLACNKSKIALVPKSKLARFRVMGLPDA